MATTKPKTSNEYRAFEDLLRTVLQVPHSELKARLDAEKKQKKAEA
jgi:hypothetical protein